MKSANRILSGIMFGIILSLLFIISSLFIISIDIPPKPFSDPLWEIIPTPGLSADIMRMPVPHGWLVAYKSASRGLAFIPDEKHEWKFNTKGFPADRYQTHIKSQKMVEHSDSNT